MNKKTAITLGSIVLGVAILSISTVLFFQYWNAPLAVEAATVEEAPASESEASQIEEIKPVSVPPIKAEPKQILEEPTASEPEDEVPPPEVSETTEPDGGVVQTPNWEAQKELAPDTDLNNPEKEPEYVKPPQSQAPAPSASSKSGNTVSTPKNGDKKTENGSTYTYLNGFGWVKDGNGGTTEYIDAPTTGNKVGN